MQAASSFFLFISGLRLIIQREHGSSRALASSSGFSASSSDFNQRFRDDPILNEEGGVGVDYDFHRYGSYSQMVSWMRALASRYSKIVQFLSIGKSHEGRSIDGLEASHSSEDSVVVIHSIL